MLSNVSRQPDHMIKFGDNPNHKNRTYLQREGDNIERDIDDDMLDILTSDYPQFVEESKTLDANLSAFEAYDQIYGAFKDV